MDACGHVFHPFGCSGVEDKFSIVLLGSFYIKTNIHVLYLISFAANWLVLAWRVASACSSTRIFPRAHIKFWVRLLRNCNTAHLMYTPSRWQADLRHGGLDCRTIPPSAVQSRAPARSKFYFSCAHFWSKLFSASTDLTSAPTNRAQVHLELTPAEVCMFQAGLLTLHSPLSFVRSFISPAPPRNENRGIGTKPRGGWPERPLK